MGINTKARILYLIGFKSYEQIAQIENRNVNTISNFVTEF